MNHRHHRIRLYWRRNRADRRANLERQDRRSSTEARPPFRRGGVRSRCCARSDATNQGFPAQTSGGSSNRGPHFERQSRRRAGRSTSSRRLFCVARKAGFCFPVPAHRFGFSCIEPGTCATTSRFEASFQRSDCTGEAVAIGEVSRSPALRIDKVEIAASSIRNRSWMPPDERDALSIRRPLRIVELESRGRTDRGQRAFRLRCRQRASRAIHQLLSPLPLA